MKVRYTLEITVPEHECVTPTTVAAVLRTAADHVEWYQPEHEIRVTAGARSPGIPIWSLTKERRR